MQLSAGSLFPFDTQPSPARLWGLHGDSPLLSSLSQLLRSASVPVGGCAPAARASALLLGCHGPKGERVICFFQLSGPSLADFSHSCFAGQLHPVFGCAGADLPRPLPSAGMSLGAEFLSSLLQYAVSQGVAAWLLTFLCLCFVYIFRDQGPSVCR